MITTTKEINLAQLDSEIGSYGLNMDSFDGTQTIEPVKDSPVSKDQLQSAVDAHVGIFPELSISEKLASVGLSVDDLKAALGL